MTRQPLSKSVSLQELQYMREQEHMTNAEIAKKLDVCPQTIRKYLGSQTQNSRGKVDQTTIDRIRSMYQDCVKIAEIAKAAGVSRETVRRYVMDLERRHHRRPVKRVAARTQTVAEKKTEKAVEQTMKNALKVINRRQTIRLSGAECRYLVDLDGEKDSVTIINGSTDVAILDAALLDRFIDELMQIRKEYFRA
jgi:DeoR/GlpR family transcriptional regulator of sugar metabolism